jgi:hypothetical protein
LYLPDLILGGKRCDCGSEFLFVLTAYGSAGKNYVAANEAVGAPDVDSPSDC